MDFHFLDDYWHTDIYSENEFYEIMNFYGSKYEDYIHANTNYDRFHVIHEIVNYYFDRNEEFAQYRYAIIEFYINNVGHIGTNAFSHIWVIIWNQIILCFKMLHKIILFLK